MSVVDYRDLDLCTVGIWGKDTMVMFDWDRGGGGGEGVWCG